MAGSCVELPGNSRDHWPFLLTLHVLSKVALGDSFFTLNGWVTLSIFLVVLVPTFVLGVGIQRGLQIPLGVANPFGKTQ